MENINDNNDNINEFADKIDNNKYNSRIIKKSCINRHFTQTKKKRNVHQTHYKPELTMHLTTLYFFK